MIRIFCKRENYVPLISLSLVYAALNIYFTGTKNSMERTGYNYGITVFIIGIIKFITYLFFNIFAKNIRRKIGLSISVLMASFFGLMFLSYSIK